MSFNCTYKYLGRVFNSELELNSFLLDNKHSISLDNISDIVYSISNRQTEVSSILKNKLEYGKRILDAKRVGEDILDGNNIIATKPYIGVTKALQRMKKADGNPLVAYFDLDNFKKNRSEQWLRTGLNKTEVKLANQILFDKNIVLEENIPLDQNIITTENLFNALVDKWNLLGKVGTSLHKVSELYWTGASLLDVQNNPEVLNYLDSTTVQQMYDYMTKLKHQLLEWHGSRDQNGNIDPTSVEFLPEYIIHGETTAVDESGNPIKLIGIIDLLVVDKKGNVHIYDYKTSDKSIDQWNSAKKLGFNYQLGFYRQILEQYGLSVSATELGIIPFYMEDFNGTSGNFSSLSVPLNQNGNINIEYLQGKSGLLSYNKNSYVVRNIENVMPVSVSDNPITSDFLNTIQSQIQTMFPSYIYGKNVNDRLLEQLKKHVKYNSSTGKWIIPDVGHNGKFLEYDNEAAAFDGLQSYHTKRTLSREKAIRSLISNIKSAINHNETSNVPLSSIKLKGKYSEWFIKEISRYCNQDWEIKEIPELESIGMILMYNTRSNYYDVIVLETSPLRTEVFKDKNKSTILGEFEMDISLKQRGVHALSGNIGNIGLIKAMLALNQIPELFRDGRNRLGEIRVLNQIDGQGAHAESHQLVDNFYEISERLKIDNNFNNGKIGFLEAHEMAHNYLTHFYEIGNGGRLNKVYSEFERNPIIDDYSLEQLTKYKNELESEFPNLRETRSSDLTSPEGVVYGYIMKAILHLHGQKHYQELRDGNKISLIIDNPDMMDSENIRNMAKIVDNGIAKLRRNINNKLPDLRDAKEKFYNAKGYTSVRRNLIGDAANLYKNMFVKNSQNEIDKTMRAKSLHDPTLDSAEKEYLTFFLDYINRYRYPDLNEIELEEMKSDPYSDYYLIPLQEAETTTKILNGKKGLFTWIKRKIENLKNPKEAFNRTITGLIDNEQQERFNEDVENYRMIDTFEYSENAIIREQLTDEHDSSFFEINLDNIAINYTYIKERKIAYDDLLGILKANLVNNLFEANLQNVDIKNIEKFLKDYTKVKILGESLIPQDLRGVEHYLAKARHLTSVLQLGFSLKQGLFQIMEGQWKTIFQSTAKPYGINQFGWKEVEKAMRLIIGDGPNHFGIVSLGELINEHYGINDQDSNVINKRLTEDSGILNFQGKLMWTVSAPDYFNRMTMFMAQMLKDGSFDAHKKVGNRLVYDWTLDNRYSIYAKGLKNDPEYKKQEALYKAAIDQFKIEGYKSTDGVSSIKYGDSLPMAYTNLEARSMKSFADQTYGYYSHETQWMLKHYFLGAQFAQFKTYYSSLKNRYFLKGNVYSQVRMEQKVDANGNKLFKKVENINGREVVMLTTEDTGIPFIDAKGSWQEGIFVSFKDMFKEMFNSYKETGLSGIAKGFNNWKKSGNEELDRVRDVNLKHFGYDMFIWSIIGLLVAGILRSIFLEQEKSNKGKNVGWGEKAGLDAAKIFTASLVTSTEDLGAFGGLISPVTDWTPPAFSIMGNIWKNGVEVVTGDKSFGKALSNNISAIRQIRNTWYGLEDIVKSDETE